MLSLGPDILLIFKYSTVSSLGIVVLVSHLYHVLHLCNLLNIKKQGKGS